MFGSSYRRIENFPRDNQIHMYIPGYNFPVCVIVSKKMFYPFYLKVILYSYLILKKMNERITDS